VITPLEIFVVSDATGATAQGVVTSALVQFGDAQSNVHRFPFTRSLEEVEQIVDRAFQVSGVIIFTFVSGELSDAITTLGRERGLVVVDLLGPLMNLFSTSLQDPPLRTPGLNRGPTQDVFRVAEAIHFTLRHDDGQGLDTLEGADLIILGMSRTGKTPTSVYLSCRELKVANIPIVRGVPLPDTVMSLEVPKVGFRMDLERQIRVRSERSRRMGVRIPGYAERANIMAEMDYTERLYREIPNIRTIDVTYRSVEEISDWITHNAL
jgi:regulator of PEP synthase PpsR (kinase-PPPase family)